MYQYEEVNRFKYSNFFFLRLEKEYTVIRKEEQEEQIEIRVCTLNYFACMKLIILFVEITK
jgi:hypothetical protein